MLKFKNNKQMINSSPQRGFTIVELLIVIVVIAILATISVVAYNGIQDRAQMSRLSSTLSQAYKKLAVDKIGADSPYPADLVGTGLLNSDGLTYSYTAGVDRSYYCLDATIGKNAMVVTSSQSQPKEGSCATQIESWSLSGGVTYENGQLKLSTTAGGVAVSPFIPTNGSNSVTILAEVVATLPAPSRTPQSGAHYNVSYYDTSKVPALNAKVAQGQYTNNGDAQGFDLNSWQTKSWTTPLSSNIAFVRYSISSSPTTYTSDNIYRNVQISFN